MIFEKNPILYTMSSNLTSNNLDRIKVQNVCIKKMVTQLSVQI